MNCSVAPAPQNSVVVASEICPSLSRHSSVTQCENSRIRYNGFLLGTRRSTPVCGMYQLKIAAMTYTEAITQIAASGGVEMPVSMNGKSKPNSTVETLVLTSAPPNT